MDSSCGTLLPGPGLGPTLLLTCSVTQQITGLQSSFLSKVVLKEGKLGTFRRLAVFGHFLVRTLLGAIEGMLDAFGLSYKHGAFSNTWPWICIQASAGTWRGTISSMLGWLAEKMDVW